MLFAGLFGSVALAAAAQECIWIEPLKQNLPGTRLQKATPGSPKWLGFVDLGEGPAPAGLATDAAGLLYATHPEQGIVDVRDAGGDVVSISGAFDRPYAIAVDDKGRAYVGEQDPGRVGVSEEGWRLQFYLGEGDGEFVNPTGIAVDSAGAGWIYVTDGGTHEVRVYGADGIFLFAFGGPGSGPGLFDFPAAIHLVPADSDDPTRLYVSDQNNDRVQILDEDGIFLACIGGSPGSQRFGRVSGLVTDTLGRLFVADAFQGLVWSFDADGALLGTVGEFGSARGQLTTPLGLAIRDGALHVASFSTGRVEAFGLSLSPFTPTAGRRAKRRP